MTFPCSIELRRVLACWVLGLAATVALAAEPLTKQAFTEHYVKLLLETHPTLDVQIKAPLEIAVAGAPNAFHLFLDNAYLQYQTDPGALDDIIRHYINSLEEVVADRRVPPGPSRIMPVIKGEEFVSVVEEQIRTSGGGLVGDHYVFEPLAQGLYIFYAFDYADSIQYITARDLQRLELAKEDLRALAVSNLGSMLSDIKKEGSDRLSYLIADGTYEASLLLVEQLWSKQNFAVEGDIVVFVLARDTVLVLGSADTEALTEARRIAQMAAAEWPYFITSKPYVLRGGKWVRF